MADDLYFIRRADGACKIGRSGNVRQRLAVLQNGCPDQLELVQVLKGAGWSEPVWHFAFRHSRIRKEWFQWSDDLARAVRAARLGREWIATLAPSEGFLRAAKREWHHFKHLPMYRTYKDRAAHVWREHIADYEEAVEDRLAA